MYIFSINLFYTSEIALARSAAPPTGSGTGGRDTPAGAATGAGTPATDQPSSIHCSWSFTSWAV